MPKIEREKSFFKASQCSFSHGQCFSEMNQCKRHLEKTRTIQKFVKEKRGGNFSCQKLLQDIKKPTELVLTKLVFSYYLVC